MIISILFLFIFSLFLPVFLFIKRAASQHSPSKLGSAFDLQLGMICRLRH